MSFYFRLCGILGEVDVATLIIRGLLGCVAQLLLAAWLLILAGTCEWPRAIRFLVTCGVVLSEVIAWPPVAASVNRVK